MTKPGQLIDDAEILARFPEDGDIIIDRLDHHPATQRAEGSGKRNRAEVEAKLKEMGRS